MNDAGNSTRCLICAAVLVKNGKTVAGTRRWRCPDCGVSSVRRRDDVTRRHQLTTFLTWLSGKQSQSEIDGLTGHSFRHATTWCWNIEPSLGPETTTHRQILVDGIYIGSWCLLIAVTVTLQVLAWQWCARESTPAWTVLLERIPAATVVVGDGGASLASAVRQTWPASKTQRRRFHMQINIRRHLTFKPRTDAGRRLLSLSKQLNKIHTKDDVITWQLRLETWRQAYGHLTKERSTGGHATWFTHDRLRKAWQLLSRLSQDCTLFTSVTHENARTTSPLTGSINNRIRTVLRLHRGMSEAHMKRAAEWTLYLHESPIDRAHELISTQTSRPLLADEETTKELHEPDH